jgi:hypothetical protein
VIVFNNFKFSEPATLVSAPTLADQLIAQPGLYVVLVYDLAWSPRPFRPLYFGESDNINSRASGTHENHSAWCREAGTHTPLYRALCPLPGWSKTQRQQMESALIANYNPPCNQKLSFDFSRLLATR